MKDLQIKGLNLNITWKNKEANFAKIESDLETVFGDLFLLPEMFATGFYMSPLEIADRENETLNWMKSFAKKKNAAVCGSVAVAENHQFYNRLYFVEPSGNYFEYDKRHLFSYSGEDKSYTAGNKKVIVNFLGWRILLQVCYDLRFPVFSRNTGDYDAILYLANWPETRIDAWKTLLKARAIENQAYVFGLNRIGTDGNQLNYPESSYCFFSDGEDISRVEKNIVAANLDLKKLHDFRTKFPFLNDGDGFTIF
jgi:omega-amidase